MLVANRSAAAAVARIRGGARNWAAAKIGA
jgi:hypothetical protein